MTVIIMGVVFLLLSVSRFESVHTKRDRNTSSISLKNIFGVDRVYLHKGT